MANEWGEALLAEAKRRILDESIPRIRKCLGLLHEEDLWYRAGPEVVSPGNLVLHLCGNARQWLGSGLLGLPDDRDRAAEFAREGGMNRAELLAHLAAAEEDITRYLDEADPATLLAERPVQIYRETGVAILVHVIEHFSYHTGQITWMTKVRRNVDTGYYAGSDLSGGG